MNHDYMIPLEPENLSKKIVLLVMDGLGGLPMEPGGKTELEIANTPNMDALAEKSTLGLHVPVRNGVIPGSGPAHLSLFGYDPVQYEVGRGVLSALGVDFDLQPSDVAARGNFCSIDENGVITDRRAGRISSEEGLRLCNLLNENINVPGAEIFIAHEKEYRFLFVIRADGLSANIQETDPQVVGKGPLTSIAFDAKSKKTAKIVQEFSRQAKQILSNEFPANMLVLRGIAQLPDWPKLPDVFNLKPIAIAMYPMYRGVAKLVGMESPSVAQSYEEEIDMLEKYWDNYDFFFVHIKKTDSYGEDGAFDKKVQEIEKVDALLPRILALDPSVLIITGDHSTPSLMKSHSWHPVPVLLYSKLCRPDGIASFGEAACRGGGLGVRFPGYELMPLAMAHAGRLEKFGA
ncbi:MAG: 2,3-bisphosphoglycerate-independent phosphoglycerate mutase [Chloroflexi bacterium]|nr:2,3-bisphosphoglycerate-independent phosphoglycerate mutase [Chloroflexota bacterium]